MLTDPISDMLSRIRNAAQSGHEETRMPLSRLKKNIAEILLKEGYIKAVEQIEGETQGVLVIKLKYASKGEPVIAGIRRLSKPGRRRYVQVDKIPQVRTGLGIAILSTSRGVMTDHDARKQRLGGELLCAVW